MLKILEIKLKRILKFYIVLQKKDFLNIKEKSSLM